MSNGKIRKNIELSPRYIELLERIKEICDIKTDTAAIEEGLVLLGWASAQAADGHAIGVLDEDDKVVREITSRALETARGWSPQPTAQPSPTG